MRHLTAKFGPSVTHSAATLLILGTLGCGSDFDPPSELSSLRVVGVKKDQPYAWPQAPGTATDPATEPDRHVELTLAWDDARAEEQREGPIQRLWFSGCHNPPADRYFSCLAAVWLGFRAFEELGPERLEEGDRWSPAQVSDPDLKRQALTRIAPELPEAVLPSVLATLDQLQLGSGDRYGFQLPAELIANHPPPTDPDLPNYGRSEVFFTVCDGQVGIAPDWQEGVDVTELLSDASRGFPLSCYDDSRRQRGPELFVAGYSTLLGYTEIVNQNPVVRGLALDGQEIPASQLCIGEACAGLQATPPDPCEAEEALRIPACSADSDGSCHKLKLEPVLRESENSEVDDLAGRGTSAEGKLLEQMWIRYYATRGQIEDSIKRLQDQKSGWLDGYATTVRLPKEPGAVRLWAVVYDNRGGLDWVRASLCIE